jgi:hypothetical protein
VLDALVFLGVSQLVLYPLVQGSRPHSAFWDTALRAVSLGILGCLATLAVLALAWRIIGARLKFSELIVAYCYMLGVFSVISSVLLLAVMGMFAASYPKTYRAMIDHSQAHYNPAAISEAFSPSPEAIESFRKLQEMPGYRLFGTMGAIAFSMALLWLFVAWGTFRQLASVSRLRSFIALAIFLLLWLPVQMIQGFAIMQSSTQDHSGSSPPSVRVEEWGYCPKAS